MEKTRILRNAQVICATCIGVGSDMFESHVFPAILMDEATQATECSTIVSLCRSAQQVVLLGDQCQLPPTVTSRTMELEGNALLPRTCRAHIMCFVSLVGEQASESRYSTV